MLLLSIYFYFYLTLLRY